jgi:hypothetical protein
LVATLAKLTPLLVAPGMEAGAPASHKKFRERKCMKLSSKAQSSINKVIEQFKSGDLPPISKVARINLDESAPARKWSLSNKIIAFMQAEELDCRGFVQWQKLGRQVKKGSKAVYIFRPHTITKTNEDEEKETVCVGFSTVPVFPASSTEGDTDLPGYTPVELPPLANIALKLGIDVNYVPVTPEKLGDCKIDGSGIRLGSHDTRVFFHELTHAIHSRIEGGLKGGQQVDQETVAEFTTAVLMDLYGLGDHTGNAWRYISHYADDPIVAITKAMGTVEKVLQVIIDLERSA